MNLCDNGHDEVCHEGRNCPACIAILEVEEKLGDAQKRIVELEAEVERLDVEAPK